MKDKCVLIKGTFVFAKGKCGYTCADKQVLSSVPRTRTKSRRADLSTPTYLREYMPFYTRSTPPNVKVRLEIIP